jgi:hypothetical protein
VGVGGYIAVMPSTDPSQACPECGVVPSRFIDGDHEDDCSLAPTCPACGCDPTTMFHGINGCPAAAADTTIWNLLHSNGLLLKPRDEKEPVIRAWLEQNEIDEWTADALRRNGFGHLLD